MYYTKIESTCQGKKYKRLKKVLVVHYVSNKKFYEELVRYRLTIRECKENNDPPPPIPNYIGECLLLIAQKLSNKPNFIGYPHKEDMIADGLENCVRYLTVFDPDRSRNPFAFFTQAIKNAFIRRIKVEKKQLYLKFKSSQSQQLTSQLNDNSFVVEDNDVVNQYIQDYEDSLLKKKTDEKAPKDEKK